MFKSGGNTRQVALFIESNTMVFHHTIKRREERRREERREEERRGGEERIEVERREERLCLHADPFYDPYTHAYTQTLSCACTSLNLCVDTFQSLILYNHMP